MSSRARLDARDILFQESLREHARRAGESRGVVVAIPSRGEGRFDDSDDSSDEYERRRSSKKDELKRLKEENRRLTEENRALLSVIARREKEIVDINQKHSEDNAKQLAKLSEALALLTNYKEEIAAYQEENERLQEENRLLREKVTELERRISDIETLFDERESTVKIEAAIVALVNLHSTHPYPTLHNFLKTLDSNPNRNPYQQGAQTTWDAVCNQTPWMKEIDAYRETFRRIKKPGNTFAHGSRPKDEMLSLGTVVGSIKKLDDVRYPNKEAFIQWLTANKDEIFAAKP